MKRKKDGKAPGWKTKENYHEPKMIGSQSLTIRTCIAESREERKD